MLRHNLPDWAHWRAQDADGTWWAYEVEPLQHFTGWYENEVGQCVRIDKEQANPQWQTTLSKIKCVSPKQNLLMAEETHWAKVEVWQSDSIRSLYLHDDTAIQSQLDLAQKHQLLKQYSRAMMSFLLFKSQPKSLLLFGLGGGSIIHFLHHWFPQLAIQAVDINERIIAIAKQYFELPEVPQINIHNCDAASFLENTPLKNQDVILIDLHDGQSLPEFLSKSDFLTQCHQALSAEGVLVFNLLIQQEQDFLPIMLALRQSFTAASLCLSLKNEQNIIVLAFKSPQSIDMNELQQRASECQEKYAIEFEQFVASLTIIGAK